MSPQNTQINANKSRTINVLFACFACFAFFADKDFYV